MIPLDNASIDWSRARRASYLVSQSFRYVYPEPIRDLKHRLVVIPPELFGDQRRMHHQLSVGAENVRLNHRQDRFGNVVIDVYASRVASSIEFLAEVSVQRFAAEPNRVPAGGASQDYLLQTSPLTAADDRIARAAEVMASSALWGLDLAERINDWVYRSMSYRSGVTGVRTTAAEALAAGMGVCQDYAHIMLALCRACGLPARYVSGHLLGQGGTHAWVEVVLPACDGTGDSVATVFDPTHASRGGLGYVTIAVGRDYGDVAPTSGSYRVAVAGRLVSRKRVTLIELDFAV